MTNQNKSLKKGLILGYFIMGALVVPYFLLRNVGVTKALPLTPPITPTVTPTTSPTPTPEPENKEPVIVTRQLKDGQFKKPYFDLVMAVDQDGDQVEVDVWNLPMGLKKNCVSHEGWGVCYISGVPQRVGVKQVVARATDGQGGEDLKSFWVRIFQ